MENCEANIAIGLSKLIDGYIVDIGVLDVRGFVDHMTCISLAYSGFHIYSRQELLLDMSLIKPTVMQSKRIPKSIFLKHNTYQSSIHYSITSSTSLLLPLISLVSHDHTSYVQDISKSPPSTLR